MTPFPSHVFVFLSLLLLSAKDFGKEKKTGVQTTRIGINSNISKVSVSLSVMSDSVTPWTVAHQAPLSVGFPRQEYWSGLPFPSGDLPAPGIEPGSFALQAVSTI